VIGYLLRRALAALPTLAAILIVTFFVLRAIPGDPTDALAEAAGGAADRAALEALRREFGLDRPAGALALEWIGRCARFDFGSSFADGAPVGRKVAGALLHTFALNGVGLLLIVSASLACGVWLAAKEGTVAGAWSGRLVSLAAAVPGAWGAMLLQKWLAADLGLFPLQGAGPPGTGSEGVWAPPDPAYLILPALALSYRAAALYSRLVRASLLRTFDAGYLRAARARGVSSGRLWLAHALRNAWLPLIATTAGLAPILVSGSVIVETLFAWPGAGRLMIDALLARDYGVVLALTWAGALITLAALLAGDLGLCVADPRLRLGPERAEPPAKEIPEPPR
jgi:peptide/nickel transport system permease protein